MVNTLPDQQREAARVNKLKEAVKWQREKRQHNNKYREERRQKEEKDNEEKRQKEKEHQEWEKNMREGIARMGHVAWALQEKDRKEREEWIKGGAAGGGDEEWIAEKARRTQAMKLERLQDVKEISAAMIQWRDDERDLSAMSHTAATRRSLPP